MTSDPNPSTTLLSYTIYNSTKLLIKTLISSERKRLLDHDTKAGEKPLQEVNLQISWAERNDWIVIKNALELKENIPITIKPASINQN